MKKTLLLLFFLLALALPSFSQTLTSTYNFPSADSYNYFWGITEQNGYFWIGSDYDNSGIPVYNYSWIYKVTKEGVILDSIHTPYKFDHGLAWDGSGFWIAEDYRSNGARLFKINTSGVKVDSIYLPSSMQGIGGLVKDGNGLWFSVYYPDHPTYPNSYAYKVDLTTKTLTDTIPLRGSQVYGVGVKGDTIFYSNDNFQNGETERIYAYSKVTHDTVFSFPSPDPDGNCNPKSLYWDGQYLWLIAERAGGPAYTFSALYKYDITGAGTPILTTLPTLDFNDVIIGALSTLNQFVQNTGTGKLIIDSVRIDNPYFSVLNSTGKDTLNPTNSKNYQVRFSPAVYGVQNATLRIYSNDGLTPVKTIAVTGRAIYGGPTISILPGSVEFGNRRKGSLNCIEVTFANLGSGVLSVTQLSNATSHFYTELATTPFNIDSVSSKTFRVWFRPDAYNSFKDTLKIYSNAVNGSIIKLPLSGIGAGVDSTLGNIYWHGVVPENPNTVYNNLQVRAMLPINDVNNDGKADLIVCSENYWTLCYNGNSSVDGNILWKFSTIASDYDAGPVEYIQDLYTSSDLNNDGINDVVIGTTGGGESVFLLNGKNGQVIWEHGDPVNYSNGDIMGVDAKRDFNNDGVKDVLACASGNEFTNEGRFSILCLNGVNGTPLWTIDQSAEHKLKYAVASTDIGGAAGSRVGTNNEVIGFNKTGSIIWTVPTSGTPWMVREIPNIGGSTNSDIIAGTTTGNIYALDGDNGTILWQTSIGASSFIEDFRIVPDVNGDGYKDIAISGISPAVYLLDGKTGAQLWVNYTGGNIISLSDVGDLNGDGASEIATGTWQNNTMYLWDGRLGTTTWSTSFGPSADLAIDMVSSLGDLDGNLSKEYAAGLRDGEIYVFSGGTAVPTPVELTALTAKVSGKNVVINWSTATELNNKGFSVERKTAKDSFREIAFVNGKGTSTEKSNYNVVDKNVGNGTYSYRLKQVDFDGTFKYSNEIEVNVGLPGTYSLDQNYPNPFNPSTTIKYAIPTDGAVKIRIFNAVGEEVATLVNELQKAGNYQVQWNGRNNSGSSVSSGIYFYRIESGSFTATKKMMLLK